MEILKILFSISLSLAAVSASLKEVCLRSHNVLRARHFETPEMEWDEDLAASAQQWAEHLASIKKFHHGNVPGVGENLYGGIGITLGSCAEAALTWYKEYKHYSYDDPLHKSTGTIGHFTQMVWKSSVKLGVGIASYHQKDYIETIIVARYSPAGNVPSDAAYKNNVEKQKDPHAKLPSKYDLDPSLCTDAAGEEKCQAYKSYKMCEPSNPSYKYMEYYCAKTCGFC